MTNNPFSGKYLDVRVKRQEALSKGQQELLRKAFKGGVDMPKSLRYTCRIAEDVKIAIGDGLEVDGEVYRLNPAAGAQFGRNADGQAFLSFALNRASDNQFFAFKWVGDCVPRAMKIVAVKHDMGEAHAAVRIRLEFDDATVRIRANKPGSRKDNRPKTRKRLKGGRSQARKFDRLGKCDI